MALECGGRNCFAAPTAAGRWRPRFTGGKVGADLTDYFRGSELDVELNLRRKRGLFQNPGYANIGMSLNYAVTPWMTLYGNLGNALNGRI
jgi:hypothetical protein